MHIIVKNNLSVLEEDTAA